MQRTRRRLLRSTDSVSSPSNCATKHRRKRTSSVCGDYSAVTEDSRKLDDPRSKLRSTKRHVRLGASKKTSRAGKFVKPRISSFQNTIVLAPFHTLKKCFQSKLIDLYSHEKMKKVNCKKKMAKNTSFEYDVTELKRLEQNYKKEEKSGKSGQKEKHDKKKRRPQSYCQCRKSKPEMGNKSPKETRKQRTRSSLTRKLSCTNYPQPSNKKRRVSNRVLAQVALKTEPSERYMSKDLNYGQHSNLSASGLSSRSKTDSWETFSDPQPCREQRLEGSLAISTTSFDSCLEQTNHFSGNIHSKPYARLKIVKRKSRNSLTKSKLGASRHLIPTKTSDGQITDFMDREPQNQVVSHVETTRHLHPLKRQSRTKVKQQNASATPKVYLLRSEVPRESTTAIDIQEKRHPKPCESNRDQRILQNESGISVLIEVGTQVEGNIGQGDGATPETSKNIIPHQSVSDSLPLPSVQYQASEEPSERAGKPAESSPEIIHRQQSNTSVSENDDNKSKAEEQDGWNGEIIEPCVLVKEYSDLPSLERIPGSSSQPEDKEPNFIFGNRNATTKLGESCEFSFGLNWVFSDDEDSDHADQYC